MIVVYFVSASVAVGCAFMLAVMALKSPESSSPSKVRDCGATCCSPARTRVAPHDRNAHGRSGRAVIHCG